MVFWHRTKTSKNQRISRTWEAHVAILDKKTSAAPRRGGERVRLKVNQIVRVVSSFPPNPPGPPKNHDMGTTGLSRPLKSGVFIVVYFLYYFRHAFSTDFCKYWLPFGLPFGTFFHHFSITFRAWILHRFFIDLGIDFGHIFDGFLMNFPFAHPPCKTFKNDDPYNEFTCFYISEKHVCS